VLNRFVGVLGSGSSKTAGEEHTNTSTDTADKESLASTERINDVGVQSARRFQLFC
jgi:hypothetical protein